MDDRRKAHFVELTGNRSNRMTHPRDSWKQPSSTCSTKKGKSMKKKMSLLSPLLAIVLMLTAAESYAGASGTEFASAYSLLTGWLQGELGRLIAIVFVAVGLVAGVFRGSLIGFVSGIAAGLGLFTAPTVIGAIVTATL